MYVHNRTFTLESNHHTDITFFTFLCVLVVHVSLYLSSGESAQPVGQHAAWRRGATQAAGQHDWPQQPVGGAEAGGEGSDWAQRGAFLQPAPAVQRSADETAR